jgi:hypothetical protein
MIPDLSLSDLRRTPCSCKRLYVVSLLSLNPINKAACQPLNFVLARKVVTVRGLRLPDFEILSQLSFAQTDKQRLTDFFKKRC